MTMKAITLCFSFWGVRTEAERGWRIAIELCLATLVPGEKRKQMQKKTNRIFYGAKGVITPRF